MIRRDPGPCPRGVPIEEDGGREWEWMEREELEREGGSGGKDGRGTDGVFRGAAGGRRMRMPGPGSQIF